MNYVGKLLHKAHVFFPTVFLIYQTYFDRGCDSSVHPTGSRVMELQVKESLRLGSSQFSFL